MTRPVRILQLLVLTPFILVAQAPPAPATEYVYMNGQAVAIEHTAQAQAPSIHISVSPVSVTLAALEQQQFSAWVTGTTNTAVT